MRGKLSLAFVVIVMLFAAALISSEQGLRRLEGAVDEAYVGVLPVVLRLQELGVRSHELALELGMVAGREAAAAVDAAEADYAHQRRKLRAGVREAGDRGAGLESALAALDDAAAELFAAARARIARAAEARDVRERVDARAVLLLDSLEDALIVESDADLLAGLEELRVSVLLARGTVRATFDAPGPERLAELRERSRVSARRATLRLASLGTAPPFETIGQLRAFLLERIQDQPAARAREEELEAEGRLAAAFSAAEDAARDLDRLSAELSRSLESETDEGRERALEAADRARLTVRVLWSLAFALSLVIVLVYVRRRIGGRISGLVSDLDRLAEGELDVEIRSHGDVELSAIARSANVFRSNARDLRRSLDALEQRNAQLSEFTYVASHDLKSPMRAIANLSDWIVEDSEGTLTPESEEHLGRLRERVARMESMLEDLLRYSRLGGEAAPRESVHLEELVREEFAVLDGSDRASLVTLRLDRRVLTVGPPLRLCVRNLLQNALAHSDRETPRIRVSLESPASESTLELFIEDDGPGVPEEDRERVFGMFRKLGHGGAGTGMGLALVRRAAEIIGGDIRVEEAAPRGARFVVTWPTDGPAPEGAASAPSADPLRSRS
ncbi:MAG: ATP-binding protein [Planctomycetota bacterium]